MIDNDNLLHIVSEYGTPTYVFDEDELDARTEKIRDILKPGSLCYSIKANPFLIPALIPVVRYFEVCSPGELSICKSLKVPSEMIIYSGVHKEESDIEDAISYGAAVITAESVRQWELICTASEKLGIKADVILRLTSGNQFGMSPEDIRMVLSKPSEQINVKGLHYFAGTGRKQIKKHEEELRMLAEMIEDLRTAYGVELPMLEYGPGLSFPYFAGDDHTDTLAPLMELAPILESISSKVEISIEMGRFIASSCGHYVTSICDIKHSSDTCWCIVDGGINHVNYLGQMMGMKVPVIRHFSNGCIVNDFEGEPCSLCGSLCTSNDVLVRELPLKDASIGDILVFENTGAYSITESMGLFLSRTLPKVVLYRGGTSRLVRDHIETWKINSQV